MVSSPILTDQSIFFIACVCEDCFNNKNYPSTSKNIVGKKNLLKYQKILYICYLEINIQSIQQTNFFSRFKLLYYLKTSIIFLHFLFYYMVNFDLAISRL